MEEYNKPVDINKLRTITNSLANKNSPSRSLDFSKIANENFKNDLTYSFKRTNSTLHRSNSKSLYNDVQRNSIYLGVSAKEMKKFHRSQTLRISTEVDADPIRDEVEDLIESKLSGTVLMKPIIPISHVPILPTENQLPNSPIQTESPITPQTSKTQETPRHEGLGLRILNRQTQKSEAYKSPLKQILSPQPSIRISPLELKDESKRNFKHKRNESENSLLSTVNIKRNAISNRFSPRRDSPNSSNNFLKRSSSKSLSSPSQKECHTVEDTLLADQEFKDFRIPSRKPSYYSLPLEKFNFERTESSRSLTPKSRKSFDFDNSSSIYYTPKMSKSSIYEVSPITPRKFSPSPNKGLPYQSSPIISITEEEIINEYSKL